MAERLNAPDSKSGIPSRVSGVQIPLSPPYLRYLAPLRGRGRFVDGNDLPLVRGLLDEPHLTVAHHRPRRIAKETLGCLMQNGIAHRIRKDEAVVGQECLLLRVYGSFSLNSGPTAGSRSSPQSVPCCSTARRPAAGPEKLWRRLLFFHPGHRPCCCPHRPASHRRPALKLERRGAEHDQ